MKLVFNMTWMTYENIEDLTSRRASDKTLWEIAFNNFKNPKYDGY